MAVSMEWLTSRDLRTKTRLKRTAHAALDYALNALVLFGFAALGVIPFAVAYLFLQIALVVNILLLLAIRSGWSQRFSDPALTVAQIFTACFIGLGGMLLAPAVAHIFLIDLFVSLAYGSLYFSKRTYLAAWGLLTFGLALVLFLAGPDMRIAVSTLPQQILTWLFCAAALARYLSVNAAVSALRTHLKSRNDEMVDASAKLKELASRDELTGLWNRREFMRLLQEEARRCARSQTSFCVAIIDIDHFKAVNDEYGHLVGDAVLHELGQLLEFSRRATDTVGRYGGEEFTLLLQGARLSTAMVALERTRHLVAQHDWSSIAPDLQLTVSAGIAAWHPGDTLTVVMNRADEALYDAKHAGRNCVRTRDRERQDRES